MLTWKLSIPNEALCGNDAKAREFAESPRDAGRGDCGDIPLQGRAGSSGQPYRWIGDTYALVKNLEKLQGPVVDKGESDFASMLRRYTLMMVDFPLHVNDKNPSMNPVEKQEYLISRNRYLEGSCRQAIKWLKSVSPAKGRTCCL